MYIIIDTETDGLQNDLWAKWAVYNQWINLIGRAVIYFHVGDNSEMSPNHTSMSDRQLQAKQVLTSDFAYV